MDVNIQNCAKKNLFKMKLSIYDCIAFNSKDTRLNTEKSYQIKLKSDCITDFPIVLESNGRSFGSKPIGKW